MKWLKAHWRNVAFAAAMTLGFSSCSIGVKTDSVEVFFQKATVLSDWFQNLFLFFQN